MQLPTEQGEASWDPWGPIVAVLHATKPYESCKTIEGQPRPFAPWELVPSWYKTIPADHWSVRKQQLYNVEK